MDTPWESVLSFQVVMPEQQVFLPLSPLTNPETLVVLGRSVCI